jgi:hypothetical protein
MKQNVSVTERLLLQNVSGTKRFRGKKKKYQPIAIQRGKNLHVSPQKRKSASLLCIRKLLCQKIYEVHYLILTAKGLT